MQIETLYTMWLKYLTGLLYCCLLARAAILPVEQDTQQGQSNTTTTSTTTTITTNKDSTLQLVHVLFRHGPRTPVETYPKDPYINETYKPFGWGQLTNAAKLELYNIGKQLQKRYKEFLPSDYQPDILRAQATESPRTLTSLQVVLAGLFPPKNTPMEWNSLLNWQPIPIYMEPEATDTLLRQSVPCPRYDEAVWEVMHSPEVAELHESNRQMLQNLTELTGFNVTYAHDVTNVFISLLSQQGYGLKVPEWSKDYYPDKMLPLATKTYVYDAYTPEMRKMKGGYYLENMYKQMQSKISGKLKPADRKLFIYCAHDWTIANVLNALNVWPNQMPRFSALIAVELHKRNDNDGGYFVEIYFQNDPAKEPKLLQVPGCDKQCPIDKLMELTRDNLPDVSYEQQCIAHGTTDVPLITYH